MTARTPDKPERPKTLGRAVHEKYPAAVVEPRDAYRDELTHVDEHGDVRMVDVGEKAVTQRLAIAEGSILMHPETQAMILEDRAKKGDVLACARVAGIMASKRTSDIIPMCHPLNLTKAKVEIAPITAPGTKLASGWAPEREDGRVGFRVRATCGVTGVTGIEMEALTAASAACLTIYDMCKAVDRGMEIVDVRLLHKEGGRSGLWERGGAEGMAGTDDATASADSANAANAAPPPSPPHPRTSIPRRCPAARAQERRRRPLPLWATRTPERRRSSRRSLADSPNAACAWDPSNTTATRALISTSPARIRGVTPRRAAAMWVSSRPVLTLNTRGSTARSPCAT